MKPIAVVLMLSALVACAASIAAAPPGHPSTDAAADMLRLPKDTSDADLPHKGKVISAIDTNQYTYIEVEQDKKSVWLAAPTVLVKKDNLIRYDDGAEMLNFYSKTLKRTFPSVMFINRVLVTNDKP